MTAQLTQLITSRDYRKIVRDQIAAIILTESAAQQVLAQKGVVSYTRADDSDYTVVSTVALPQIGVYTVTAGTLVDGVGTWTVQAPDSSEDECTTTQADDDLGFSELGLTLETTAESSVWDTGDIITVTTHDPLRWKLRVYTGKSDPLAAWIDAPDNDTVDATPIVNVWFERQSFPKGKGNTFSRQQGPAIFHIDAYGYGKAAETAAGHTPGDEKAEDQADWACTLNRNFIMAAAYNWLDMMGYVASRWPTDVQFFQPQRDGRWVQHVAAYRLTLEVEFNEFAPQVEGNPCEGITTTIYKEADGEVLLKDRQDFS